MSVKKPVFQLQPQNESYSCPAQVAVRGRRRAGPAPAPVIGRATRRRAARPYDLGDVPSGVEQRRNDLSTNNTELETNRASSFSTESETTPPDSDLLSIIYCKTSPNPKPKPKPNSNTLSIAGAIRAAHEANDEVHKKNLNRRNKSSRNVIALATVPPQQLASPPARTHTATPTADGLFTPPVSPSP